MKPGDVIVCRSAPALGELTINVRAHETGAVDEHRATRLTPRQAAFGRLQCCKSSAPAIRR